MSWFNLKSFGDKKQGFAKLLVSVPETHEFMTTFFDRLVPIEK
jgi:hypothetical protein